jgi:histone H3/H4
MEVDDDEGAGTDAEVSSGSQARADPTAAAAAGAAVPGSVHPPAAGKQPVSVGAAAAAAEDKAGPSTAAAGASAAAGGDEAAAAAGQQGGSGDESELDSELLSDPDTDDADEASEVQAVDSIRFYQHSSHLLTSRFAFKRVAEDTLCRVAPADYSLEPLAVEALQHACEGYLIDLFEASNLCGIHCGRQKLKKADMLLAHRLFDLDLFRKRF